MFSGFFKIANSTPISNVSFKSISETLTKETLEGNMSDPDSSNAYLEYKIDEITDNEITESKLSSSTTLSGGIGPIGANGSISGEVDSSEKENHHQYRLTFQIILHANTFAPNQNAKKRLESLKSETKDLMDFYEKYGDSFLETNFWGGKITVDFSLDENIKSLKKQLSGRVGISGSEIAKVKQELDWLNSNESFHTTLRKDAKIYPPLITPTGDPNIKSLEEMITKFRDEITKKDVKLVCVDRSVKPYRDLVNNEATRKLFELSESHKSNIKELNNIQINIKNIKISNRSKYVANLHKKDKLDIVRDFEEKQKNCLENFAQQIPIVIKELKDNIFNQKTKSGDDIALFIRECKEWKVSNDKLFQFSSTHTLAHIIDPHEKKKVYSYHKFLSGTIPLFKRIDDKSVENYCLYIDVVNKESGVSLIGQCPTLRILRKSVSFPGSILPYQLCFSNQVECDTQLYTENNSTNFEFNYVPLRLFLDKDNKKGWNINIKLDGFDDKQILVRIYLCKKADQLGTINEAAMDEIQHSAATQEANDAVTDNQDTAVDLDEFTTDSEKLKEIGLYQTDKLKNQTPPEKLPTESKSFAK